MAREVAKFLYEDVVILFFFPLGLVIEERIWHFLNEAIEHFTSTFMIARTFYRQAESARQIGCCAGSNEKKG